MESGTSWTRPYSFWQWESYGVHTCFHLQHTEALTDHFCLPNMQTYIEFIGALVAGNTIAFFALGWTDFYVDFIGLVALGLESTVCPVVAAL